MANSTPTAGLPAKSRDLSLLKGTSLLPAGIRRMFRLTEDPSTTTIEIQPLSPLLCIPAELRLQIYEYLFPEGFECTDRNVLAILQTCRLINYEATQLVFRHCDWKLNITSKLNLQPRLQTLGVLAQHLRFVTVQMDLDHVDPAGTDNPFLLTQLPLKRLTISLTEPILRFDQQTWWKNQSNHYYKIVSAFLYLSAPGRNGRGSKEIHNNVFLRNARQFRTWTWNWRPQPEHMEDVVARFKAEEVLVECNGTTRLETLWNAFSHFELVQHYVWRGQTTLVSADKSSREKWDICWMFFDKGPSNTSYWRAVRKRLE